MKLLLYCTKSKPYLLDLRIMGLGFQCMPSDSIADLNGKIVAECDFVVEEIKKKCVDVFKYCYITDTLNEFELMNKTQLDGNTTNNYLKGKNGYAIHIKNLHIFDEPKELSECEHFTTKYGGIEIEKVKKAPQNMMYVMLTEKGLDDYILISIQPQWLCKILNGEKTIEVRKKVLKEMLK